MGKKATRISRKNNNPEGKIRVMVVTGGKRRMFWLPAKDFPS